MGFLKLVQALLGDKKASAPKQNAPIVTAAPKAVVELLMSVRLRQVTFVDDELTVEQQAEIMELQQQFRKQLAIVGSEQWVADMELLCIRSGFNQSMTTSREEVVQFGRHQKHPAILPRGSKWFFVHRELVSRTHCQVQLDVDGVLWVTDCGSKYGSLIFRKSGERSEHREPIKVIAGQQVPIRPGDYLLLGPKGRLSESVLIAVEDPED